MAELLIQACLAIARVNRISHSQNLVCRDGHESPCMTSTYPQFICMLRHNLCRLSITHDRSSSSTSLSPPSPPLYLFQNRHNNRHANRREKRRVDRILVFIGLSDTLGVSSVGISVRMRLTKYNSPTIFGLKNARSAKALARFVLLHTSINRRVPLWKASSNNRTASSTSFTTSFPTRIS